MKSPDSLIHKALLNLKDDNNRVIGWALEVTCNKLLNDLGFSYLWNNENITLLHTYSQNRQSSANI